MQRVPEGLTEEIAEILNEHLGEKFNDLAVLVIATPFTDGSEPVAEFVSVSNFERKDKIDFTRRFLEGLHKEN